MSSQSTIVITGSAAQKLFYNMDMELLQGVSDASENDGTRVDLKVGESITCYAYTKTGKNLKLNAIS